MWCRGVGVRSTSSSTAVSKSAQLLRVTRMTRSLTQTRSPHWGVGSGMWCDTSHTWRICTELVGCSGDMQDVHACLQQKIAPMMDKITVHPVDTE